MSVFDAEAQGFYECFVRRVALWDDSADRESLRLATEWIRLLRNDWPARQEVESLDSAARGGKAADPLSARLRFKIFVWVDLQQRRARLRREGLIRE